MRMAIFMGFLLTAAGQDMYRKRIRIWVFVLFGAMALAADGYLWNQIGDEFSWWNHLWSCSVGAGLLLLGKICRGGIGAGDGLFFLISGLLLEFWENLVVLCMGVILCGLYGLCIFVWKKIQTGENTGKQTVPFLPFAVVPGVWMAVANCFWR